MSFMLHRWQWYAARTELCDTLLRESWSTMAGLISTENSYWSDWLTLPNLEMPEIIRVLLHNIESSRILESVQSESVKAWAGTGLPNTEVSRPSLCVPHIKPGVLTEQAHVLEVSGKDVQIQCCSRGSVHKRPSWQNLWLLQTETISYLINEELGIH